MSWGMIPTVSLSSRPGATFDMSSSRPGYWYGNGCLPRLSQRGGVLTEVFAIPDEHPVGFTHAHWPADAFDRQELREHWAFGAKGTGRVALWSSGPLAPHSEVLTGRELRAWGARVAWLCICAGEAEDGGGAGGFDGFVKRCLGMAPRFDPERMTLQLRGGEAPGGEAGTGIA